MILCNKVKEPFLLIRLIRTLLLFTLLCPFFVAAAPQDVGVDYDIVYVRYPGPKDSFVTIPQGEKPYLIAAGADLVLLKPNGTEIILVDCTDCSVMDPFISYDAKYVYYSLIEEASKASASWIYKIDLSKGAPYTPIRLTYDDGFDSLLYAGNNTTEHDQSSFRKIRDMAPVPLSDGRVLFTSNRSALTALNPGTDAVVNSSVQQMYVMDDHDGSANSAVKSNLHRLETGSLHMVQHPLQLKDGRILFSTWQDVALKFRYAMTCLFTVHPDGSNMRQFTEPHDHHKNVEHFITQLPDEQIVSGWYYPSFDYGFGALLRYPISSEGPDFLRYSIDQREPFGKNFRVSYREFDRKGTLNMTPHTSPSDRPAPNLSGKYSMPSVSTDGDMLVAYSSGSTNHFLSACQPDNCKPLKSGIYLIKNAANTLVNDPKELVKIKDSPDYNEIWPRAVVTYKSLMGVEKPEKLPSLAETGSADSRIDTAEATALVGTSSMYNRDSSDPEKFQSPAGREFHDGNWTIQGAEAGVFTNSDIYAVRIIGTPPKPFTKPIRKFIDRARWNSISGYLHDKRLNDVVARYGSLHSERWEIIGEFPLTHKNTLDEQGNPDTSWVAKIPAETPFLIQTLDKNGMTLISELTWRALKPGEKRVDCGGCHAHAVEPLDFATTEAGKAKSITGVPGVSGQDARVADGLWDLTSGSIPVLAKVGSSNGVKFHSGRSMTVEFRRDVMPIFEAKCNSCHSSGGSASSLVFDNMSADDLYAVLTDESNGSGGKYVKPQRSRYIRVPQARQSLLVWIAYGQRLDGRTNGERSEDIDYPAHPVLNLKDDDKRTIARWVDLGSPIDFVQTNGFGYTEDNSLPIINVFTPKRGATSRNNIFEIGFVDAHSGLDWSSLRVQYYQQTNQANAPIVLTPNMSKATVNGVVTVTAPSTLEFGKSYILEVQIKDNVGNVGIDKRRFFLSNSPPDSPGNLSIEKIPETI